MRGRYESAVEDLTRLIEVAPKSKHARTARGTAYSELGKLDRSLADFDKAVAVNPKDPYARLNRALVYLKLGRAQEVAVDYKLVARSSNHTVKAAHDATGLPSRGRDSGRPTAVLREPQTISERIGRAVDDAVRPVGEFFDGLSRQIASMVPWVSGSVDTRGAHYGKNARMVGSGLQLPPTGLGYKSTTPQRWGTGRMVRLIQYAGAYAHQHGLPDLEIRDISKEGGGRLAWYSKSEKRWIGHRSHRIGLDADIRNFFKPAGTVWRKKGNKRWREQVYAFDTERNWVVLRGILQYRVPDRRGSPVQFVFTSQSNRNKLLAHARKHDPSLYREAARVLNVEPNHGGHYHVRLYN